MLRIAISTLPTTRMPAPIPRRGQVTFTASRRPTAPRRMPLPLTKVVAMPSSGAPKRSTAPVLDSSHGARTVQLDRAKPPRKTASAHPSGPHDAARGPDGMGAAGKGAATVSR